MILNSLLSGLQESATLRINNLARHKRQSGETVFHFGFGESPFPVPKEMQQALRAHVEKKSYLPGLGLIELRETIANFLRQHFGYDYHYERIAIGPGSKELLFDTLYILQGTLLIPAPSWVSYKPIAQLLGKRSVAIQTTYQNQFKLTVQELEVAIQQNPDEQYLLILNSPSNPTGQTYSVEELKQLATLCRQHNVYVLSDEIYALLTFNNAGKKSTQQKAYAPGIARYLPEKTFVTGGISKAFCAGGWRLGYIAFPEASYGKSLQTLASETFSCVNAPVQYAAIKAFEMSDAMQQMIDDTSTILRLIADYCQQRLLDMGVDCLQSEGGFYLFPNFDGYREQLNTAGIHTVDQWCQYLMGNYNIALLPGTDFGRPENEFTVRVAYVDFDGAALLSNYQQDCGRNADSFKGQLETSIPSMVSGLNTLQTALSTLGQ